MITKVEKEKLSLKNIIKKNLFTLGIISFCFLVERFTKIKILKLNPDINKIFLNDFINIDLVWNTGIGFGLLSQTRIFLSFYKLINFL